MTHVRARLGSPRVRRMGGRLRLRVPVHVCRQARAAAVGVLALGAVLVWTDGRGGSVIYSPDACAVTDTGALVCETSLM